MEKKGKLKKIIQGVQKEKRDKNKPQFVSVSLSKWRFKNWYLARMF